MIYNIFMNNFEHDIPREFVKKVEDLVNLKKTFKSEIKKVSENSQDYWYQDSIMPIYDDDGKKLGEVIVHLDITDKKYFEELSITDGLTKLYNRRHFDEILSREINRSCRNKNFLSFIILDIDFFKTYNDCYGHKAGDEVLKSISKSIKNTLHRGSDYAFRLGGEEFGIIFSGLNMEESLNFSEQIRSNIEGLKINHSNTITSKYVTVSMGLLVVDFSTENVDEQGFYTMADAALYHAKKSGRNRVVLHENI